MITHKAKSRKRAAFKLLLEESYSRVLKEERRGRKLIPDALSFADYSVGKDHLIQDIRSSLNSNSYTADSLLSMDVPNDSYWLRPGAVPVFKDWVLYDAIAYYIGQKVDSKLRSNVFSYRFNEHGDLKSGVEQWKKFEDSFWQNLNTSTDDTYAVTTDITSYFTNINLSVLQPHILTLLNPLNKTDERIVNSLFDVLLKPWSSQPLHIWFGIPQGVDASSILANLLLHHIDDYMSRLPGVIYFRYVDDIRIITQNKVTAKKTLGRLVKILRGIGLDINKSKTKLLSKEQAINQLYDSFTGDMDRVYKLIRSKRKANIEIAIPLLSKIFDYAFSSHDPLYQRHLSFVINRLILLRRYMPKNKGIIKKVAKTLISHLEQLPGCSADSARFFRYFSTINSKKAILNFLKSNDNIYGWQEMWLIDCLLRCNKKNISGSDLEYLYELALMLTDPSFVVQKPY